MSSRPNSEPALTSFCARLRSTPRPNGYGRRSSASANNRIERSKGGADENLCPDIGHRSRPKRRRFWSTGTDVQPSGRILAGDVQISTRPERAMSASHRGKSAKLLKDRDVGKENRNRRKSRTGHPGPSQGVGLSRDTDVFLSSSPRCASAGLGGALLFLPSIAAQKSRTTSRYPMAATVCRPSA